MTSNLSIPNLRAWAQINMRTGKLEIADQIGSVLGLHFASDTIGWFEELDALVSKVFYFIVGVYEIDDDRLNIELRSMIDKSLLAGETINIATEYLDISEFLSALLHAKLGIPVDSIKENSQQSKSVEIQIPNFHVSLQTASSLSLEQISARVGVALGVSFGQTVKPVSKLEMNYHKGQPWYSQIAHSFGHQITVYVATAHHRLAMARPVALEVRPDFSIEQLGLDPKVTKTRKLDMSKYIASLLQVETDLTFK